MNESFPLLVCTKEDFNAFKVTAPSKDTLPAKIERRPLVSKDYMAPNNVESRHPFDPSAESFMASVNGVCVCP